MMSKRTNFFTNFILYSAMDSRTDFDLLTAIQERTDPAALGTLYDRYGQSVYALAYGILRCKADAEDILQEVFERVWQKGYTFQQALGDVKYWLLRIAHNRSINRLKARALRTAESVTTNDSPATDIAETEPNLLEAPMDFDISEFIQTALAYLPSDQRHVIELAFFRGLSHAEIAETERLPLGTVKTRIRSGLKQLRTELHFLKS